MKRIGEFVFVVSYCLLVAFLMLQFLDLCDLYIKMESKLYIYGAWLLICFSGYWWRPTVYLAGRRVRKTILEEEAVINPLLEEVNERSQIADIPKFLILESTEPDAFAIGRRTVVLSRGIFKLLTPEEIKAVLAHEYGHLRDRDGFLSCAFSTAAVPFRFLSILIFKVTRRLKKVYRFLAYLGSRRTMSFILLLAIIIFILWMLRSLFPVFIILFLFYKLYPYFVKLAALTWFYFSRVTEYRQDQFAQSLGYGLALKSALLKICPLSEDVPIERVSVLYQAHPIIADRVRRIEWLEGLRTTL